MLKPVNLVLWQSNQLVSIFWKCWTEIDEKGESEYYFTRPCNFSEYEVAYSNFESIFLGNLEWEWMELFEGRFLKNGIKIVSEIFYPQFKII